MSAAQTRLSAADVPALLQCWKQACHPMSTIDLDEIDEIEREIYPFPWSRGNFVDSIRSNYDAWVLRDGNRLLAYCVCMLALDEAHLLNISVAKGAQGLGLGRHLLGWVEQGMAQQGALSMLLEVRPSNSVAQGLYQSVGYQRIGMRKAYYPALSGREDAIVMRKMLQGEGAGSTV